MVSSLDIPPACLRIEGLGAIASRYDVVLSDVWGVVHDGEAHFAPAVAALARFRAEGGTVVLITNAPRPRGPVLAQLDHLRVPRDGYDAIVTSGDVTLALIAEHGDAPVHHIGPPRDLALFDELAVRPPLVSVDAASRVVCTGLDDDAEALEDYDLRLARMRARALPMICANPDLVVHIGDALVYCAGALAQRYVEQGGTAIYAGKPHRPIYDRALALAQEARGRPVDPARVLCIGDAMRTDVAGARACAFDSLFLTSGIHRDDFSQPHGEALADAALSQFLDGFRDRPTYVMADLAWSV